MIGHLSVATYPKPASWAYGSALIRGARLYGPALTRRTAANPWVCSKGNVAWRSPHAHRQCTCHIPCSAVHGPDAETSDSSECNQRAALLKRCFANSSPCKYPTPAAKGATLQINPLCTRQPSALSCCPYDFRLWGPKHRHLAVCWRCASNPAGTPLTVNRCVPRRAAPHRPAKVSPPPTCLRQSTARVSCISWWSANAAHHERYLRHDLRFGLGTGPQSMLQM